MAVTSPQTIDTWLYQPNAFSGQLPYADGAFTRYSVIDVNGDGFKDIVFHFKESVNHTPVLTGNAEADNRLAIFINVGGTRFEDRTSQYLTGPTNIGGVAADQLVLDLNGDGKLDIIYATNQEDSRHSDNWPDFYGPISLLLSGPDGYHVVQTGDSSWHHNVGYGIFNGQYFVFTAETPQAGGNVGVGFTFANGGLVASSQHFPPNFSLANEFISDGNSADTRYLIQENPLRGMNVLEGWALNDAGGWDPQGTIDKAASGIFVKMVQFLGWNAVTPVPVDVYQSGGQYILKGFGALDNVGIMRLSPAQPQIAIIKQVERVIDNFDSASNDVVLNNQTSTIQKLGGFTIQNGQLIEVDLHIQGEVTAVDFEMSAIVDANGDGYDDIVIQPYNQSGLPIFYINDQHGGFVRQQLTVPQAYDYGRSDAASSIVADFNNDGRLDIVTLPANGQDLGLGTAMTNFRYYVSATDTVPTFAAPSLAISTVANGSIRFAVAAADADGDPLAYSATTPGHGSINGGAAGSFTYTPAKDFRGTDSIVVTADDGKGGATTQTVTVTVAGLAHFAAAGAPVVANFNPAFGWASQDQYPRHVADVNGDGYADIVGFGTAGVLVSFGSAGGSFTGAAVRLADFGQNAGWATDNGFHRELADVNGDGRADILGFGFAGTLVSLAKADGTFGAVSTGITDFGVNQGWANQNGFARTVGDVNGDGKADIIGFGFAGALVALGNGNGTFQQVKTAIANFGVNQGWTSDNTFHRAIADVNGDGRADLVGFGIAGTYVALSNGDGTFADAQLVLNDFGTNQGWSSNDSFSRLVADVNGDHIADIVGFGIAGTLVAFGKGDGTFTQASLDVGDFGKNQGWTSDNTFHREVADMNKDGLADVVGFGIAGVLVGTNQGDFLV